MNLSNIMGAVAQAKHQTPTNMWSTKPFQCDNTVPRAHWLYAAFCFPCTAAHAKSVAEKSNPVFNCLCFTPLGAYNSVRLSYHVMGECSTDLLYGGLCMPCGARQAWTEANLLGPLPGTYGGDQADWTVSLFDCEARDCLMAGFCPCLIAHAVRLSLQPEAATEPWFDYLCVVPMSMYGQTRHTIGIKSEWPHPTCEDLAVGCFFYPCALNRAKTEAIAWRMKVSGASVVSAAGDSVQNAKNKAAAAAGNAKQKASDAATNAKDKFGKMMK